MSQQKKAELPERIREFRGRARLSQDELGERLGVSGNYISLIELGKKAPGPSLQKLFETLERSPLYQAVERSWGEAASGPGGGEKPVPSNPLFAMLSMDTLIRTFGEVTDKLAQGGSHDKKQAIGTLREMLDEMERRLVVSSGGLSEAQQIAMKASQPGGNRETK